MRHKTSQILVDFVETGNTETEKIEKIIYSYTSELKSRWKIKNGKKGKTGRFGHIVMNTVNTEK